MGNSSFKKILLFLTSRNNLLFILLAVVGSLLALQGKQPVAIGFESPRFLLPPSDTNIEVMVKPPVHYYQGLIEARISYIEAKEDITARVMSGENRITEIRIVAGKSGSSAILLYPGQFDAATGLSFIMNNNSGSKPPQVITSVEFHFPKTGNWLIPDLFLWASLGIIAVSFGLICALAWKAPLNVLASFGATVVVMIFVLQFGGLEIAQRIADQIFAVIFLLLAVFLIKTFIMKPSQVKIQS